MRTMRWVMAAVVCVAACGPGLRAAWGQVSPFYPDDSLVARETLLRVGELAAAENFDEAVRVLQDLLDQEADRVVEPEAGGGAGEPVSMVSVRVRVHETLLASPRLLQRYREIEGPAARRALEAGEWNAVEHVRLLTDAGYEACLRVAQLELEAARFEGARLALLQIEKHPLRQGKSDTAAEAARLAARIAQWLPREEVAAWSTRWMNEAGVTLDGPAENVRQKVPAALLAGADSVFDPGPIVDLMKMPARPLVHVAAGAQHEGVVEDAIRQRVVQGERDPRATIRQQFGLPWVLPIVRGERVFVNNGRELSAWDRFTLSPLWRVRPAPSSGIGAALVENDTSGLVRTAEIDDLNTFTLAGGGAEVGVAATGVPVNGGREGDGRIHAVDLSTGRLLWSIDPAWLDRSLEGASVRGELLISGDIVIASIRRVSSSRKITGAYLAGIDLWSGEARWVRPLGTTGGSTYSMASRPVESSVLHQGVVYRVDSLGVAAAVEAHSGRIVWLRRIAGPEDTRFTSVTLQTPQPWAVSRPVVLGDSLFVLEPGGKFVRRLRLADGASIAVRECAALAEPRFLLEVGGTLACVGESMIAFVDPNQLATAPIFLSESMKQPEMTGRPIVMGSGAQARLLVPRDSFFNVIDPAAPRESVMVRVGGAGPAATATDELANERADASARGPGAEVGLGLGHLINAGDHFLMMDASSLYSYTTWDNARSVLEARMTNSPDDPAAALSLASLAFHAGKLDAIAPAADAVLTLHERWMNDPAQAPAGVVAARRRLFESLLSMLRAARAAAQTQTPTLTPGTETARADTTALSADLAGGGLTMPQAGGLGTDAGRPDEVVWLDPIDPREIPPATCADLLARMGRAAQSASERAEFALMSVWLSETRGEVVAAVEALQSVLLDTDLAEALVDQGAVVPRVAGAVARDRLARVLIRFGWEPYRVFEDQASGELTTLLEGRDVADAAALSQGEAERLRDLARRYPASTAAITAWTALANRAQNAGNLSESARFLGRAVGAASMGPTDPAARQRSEAIVNRLVELDVARGEPLRARRVIEESQVLGVLSPAAALSAKARVDPAVNAGPGRDGGPILPPLPLVADRPSGDVETLVGWTISPAVISQGWSRATDAVAMVHPASRRLALMAPSIVDGRLRARWERRFDRTPPKVLRIDRDATYLYWPGGVSIERVNADGSSAWVGRRFEEVFAAGEAARGREGDGFQAPQDGFVRSGDMLVAMDDQTLVLIERSGRAASFDLAKGEVLWTTVLPAKQIYDATLAGGVLVVGGAVDSIVERPAEGNEPRRRPMARQPVLMTMSSRTPESPKMLSPEGVADSWSVRWVRAIPEPRSAPVAGVEMPARALVAVGLSDRVVLLDAAANRLRWSLKDARVASSMECWTLGDALFILSGRRELWRVPIEGEKAGTLGDAAQDTRGRFLDDSPVAAGMLAMNANAFAAFATVRGLVVYDASGALVGADVAAPSFDTDGGLVAMLGATSSVMVSMNPRLEAGGQRSIVLRTLQLPGGKLSGEFAVPLSRPVTTAVLIDGRALLTAGSVTVSIGLE